MSTSHSVMIASTCHRVDLPLCCYRVDLPSCRLAILLWSRQLATLLWSRRVATLLWRRRLATMWSCYGSPLLIEVLKSELAWRRARVLEPLQSIGKIVLFSPGIAASTPHKNNARNSVTRWADNQGKDTACLQDAACQLLLSPVTVIVGKSK